MSKKPLKPVRGQSSDARFAAIAEVTALLRGGESSKETIAAAFALLARLIPADAYALWRHDYRTHVWLIAASVGLSDEYVHQTILEDEARRDEDLLHEPFVVDELQSWSVASGRAQFYAKEKICSMLVAPLRSGEGAGGTLCCYFRKPREVTDDERAIAAAVADVLVTALSTKKVDRLTEIGRKLAGESDIGRLVHAVTEAATELTGAEFGAFLEKKEGADDGAITVTAASGEQSPACNRFVSALDVPLARRLLEGTLIAIRISDIARERSGGYEEVALELASCLAVPVVSRAAQVLGSLVVGNSEAGMFMDAELRTVETLAAQAAMGIDNARMYEALQRDREATARSELRYRSLVNATASTRVILVAKNDGTFDEGGPAWRDLTGQTRAEMAGRGWAKAVHPADRTAFVSAWNAAFDSGSIFHEEFRLRLSDGWHRWFEGKAVPVRGEDGRILEWITTFTDIHEQKTTQDGLRFLARATEILSSSLDYEATLAMLARIAVPGIADWCAVDVANEPGDDTPYRRVAVAHADPAKVSYARRLQEIYPPDPENDQTLKVMRTGEAVFVPEVPKGLFESVARDEEHLRVINELGIRAWMVIPLRARGRVLGALSLISSDSERRFTDEDLHLGEEFARRAALAIDNARLFSLAQSANRAKDEFLATLSHELRTPMTAVVGWSRMLKLGLDEEGTKEAIDAIERSAAVQAQLIDDILDMSRIMSGRLRIEIQPVDLRVVARAALSTVQPAAIARGVWIVTDFENVPALVRGDEGRLQQVIWNLLSNAIKFTTRGGSVVLRMLTEGSTLSVEVEDTGKGIAPEFLPHVFEAFRQEDSSTTRAHSGIGLGLAIVKHLIELHGGRISVSSEGVGRGSKFVIELPLLESAMSDLPRQKRAVEPAFSQPPAELPRLDGLTVLVIDDQPYTREIVLAILERAGASITAAESVREGLARVDEFLPDVVVCDIAMPQEDGYAFVRKLRARRTAADTPVVALTAFGRPEDRDNALNVGFDAYLKKPVDPADLAATVRDVYERGQKKARKE